MLLGRIVEQPGPVAEAHGIGGHHLGIEHGAARQQTVEHPAMPVGPIHHRRDRETPVQRGGRTRHGAGFYTKAIGYVSPSDPTLLSRRADQQFLQASLPGFIPGHGQGPAIR